MSRDKQSGFTLAELLVVLAVLALSLSLVMPRLGATSDVHSRAAELAALFRLARSEAIFRNEERTVVVDFAARRIAIPGTSRALAVAPDIGLTVLTARDEIVKENAAIRFLPDGSSTGGAVILAGKTKTLRIKVNWLTGAVSIDDGPFASDSPRAD